MAKKEHVVGLDIGTTKTACFIGELQDANIEVIGVGIAPSTGLRKGVVVNIEATVASIAQAVSFAEKMANCHVSTVYAGIAGGHIRSFNSTGIVAVRDREISAYDVGRVLEAARAVPIALDREILHVIPQEYIIDHQDGIRQPIGMSGVRLEARVHMVTGALSSAQNIIKCVNQAGLSVSEICLEPIASSEAVLSRDEKELGVILIDIGGGTSDLAIFREGALIHTSVLPIGGNHLTRDIAVGLRTPQKEAENLKIQWGCALSNLVSSDQTIEVPGVGGRDGRTLPRRALAQIIEPRLEEIFSLIHREVMKSGLRHLLSAGVVITGGASLLEGLPELAEFIFEMPVKRGMPQAHLGRSDLAHSPKFATGVGLLHYGAKHMGEPRFPVRERNLYAQVRHSMQAWIKNWF